MGDFPINLVSAPERFRFGRLRASIAGIVPIVLCLGLAGGNASRVPEAGGPEIAGLASVAALPAGTSWAPAPVVRDGLSTLASTSGTTFALHTAGGDRTFLPGVNLGATTPGFQPGELSISESRYRSWIAAMGRLGIRVVRTYTIHPPVFYRELARHNLAHPDQPIYLMQGVHPPDTAVTGAFAGELRDAANAVTGVLVRPPAPGRAGGVWDSDVTPWLAGWIIEMEFDPDAARASDERTGDAPAVDGRYFRSTKEASPTERRLAARMEELAGYQAARGLSRPIAFVNRANTDANHVQPTKRWPGGTFAAFPYTGDLGAYRRHHGDIPTMITEFGVPSSIGSARHGPLGRSEGDHSERDAMRIDAELLRLIHERGLAGGFLAGWADEWFTSSRNTAKHQDPARRQLWHDVLTSGQHFGLLALDPAGPPGSPSQRLLDDPSGWPARLVSARTDEAYLHLSVRLGGSLPGTLSLGFDVLPSLSGAPGPDSGDQAADTVLTLDLVALTGQAYLREALDPVPLDHPVPDSARGPAPDGWRRLELVMVDPEQPVELQNAGLLRHGDWDPGNPEGDSRALWRLAGDDLTVRVPWAFLGFSDPSAHQVLVPGHASQRSPGVAVTVSATGTDQRTGRATWAGWNRPFYTERLKPGAEKVRDAIAVTS